MAPPTFPLIVHADERRVLRTALQVYRGDFGHPEHRIVELVDEVLARLPDDEHVPLDLDAAAMKVTWSALHALLDDTRRDQESDRAHLHALLRRLPDEPDIAAIDLDAELARRPR
ncbi:MAG TPA: hypothetical protein VNT03_14565 [Baekduia sp.]|nr:hypothetical protein [Baekduia sp.]